MSFGPDLFARTIPIRRYHPLEPFDNSKFSAPLSSLPFPLGHKVAFDAHFTTKEYSIKSVDAMIQHLIIAYEGIRNETEFQDHYTRVIESIIINTVAQEDLESDNVELATASDARLKIQSGQDLRALDPERWDKLDSVILLRASEDAKKLEKEALPGSGAQVTTEGSRSTEDTVPGLGDDSQTHVSLATPSVLLASGFTVPANPKLVPSTATSKKRKRADTDRGSEGSRPQSDCAQASGTPCASSHVQGPTKPDIAFCLRVSARLYVLLHIELKWLKGPRGKARSDAISSVNREGVYQSMCYLYNTSRLFDTHLAVTQVNEFFCRMAYLPGDTIVLETSTNTPAASGPSLSLTSPQVEALTISELDECHEFWARLPNSLIDPDTDKPSKDGCNRLLHIGYSALYLAGTFDTQSEPEVAMEKTRIKLDHLRQDLGLAADSDASPCPLQARMDDKQYVDSFDRKTYHKARHYRSKSRAGPRSTAGAGDDGDIEMGGSVKGLRRSQRGRGTRGDQADRGGRESGSRGDRGGRGSGGSGGNGESGGNGGSGESGGSGEGPASPGGPGKSGGRGAKGSGGGNDCGSVGGGEAGDQAGQGANSAIQCEEPGYQDGENVSAWSASVVDAPKGAPRSPPSNTIPGKEADLEGADDAGPSSAVDEKTFFDYRDQLAALGVKVVLISRDGMDKLLTRMCMASNPHTLDEMPNSATTANFSEILITPPRDRNARQEPSQSLRGTKEKIGSQVEPTLYATMSR